MLNHIVDKAKKYNVGGIIDGQARVKGKIGYLNADGYVNGAHLNLGYGFDYPNSTARLDFNDEKMFIDALYYKPLFKDAKFRALAKERWNALKNKLATIPEFIDQTAEHIAVSEVSNHKLWPIDSANNGDEQLSFPDAVERLKKAYQGKFEYMDKEIKKW